MSTALRRYFRGANLVAMQDVVAGKKYVYHFDEQGTTQCLTDAATGAVTDRFSCDAWGVPVKRSGTSINRKRSPGVGCCYSGGAVALGSRLGAGAPASAAAQAARTKGSTGRPWRRRLPPTVSIVSTNFLPSSL